jgi:predicted transcriptional regulator
MSTKEKILNELDSLSPQKQEQALGVLENFIHGQEDDVELTDIPEGWKKRIDEGLKQVEAGLTYPHEEVMKRIKSKLGIDG